MNDAAAERFWAWCLDIYARPGVADALIALQDEQGGDVPFLLWAARRRLLGAAALSPGFAESVWVECAPWAREVTAAVRRARRAAKALGEDGAAYAALKTCELACERRMLERLAARLPIDAEEILDPDPGLMADDLRRALSVCGARSPHFERVHELVGHLTGAGACEDNAKP